MNKLDKYFETKLMEERLPTGWKVPHDGTYNVSGVKLYLTKGDVVEESNDLLRIISENVAGSGMAARYSITAHRKPRTASEVFSDDDDI